MHLVVQEHQPLQHLPEYRGIHAKRSCHRHRPVDAASKRAQEERGRGGEEEREEGGRERVNTWAIYIATRDSGKEP